MVIRNKLRDNYLYLVGTFLSPKNGVHILNGHYISPDSDNPQIFEDQMSKLSKKVSFVYIQEAIELIEKQQQVKSPIVAFTYDDGFKECLYSIAPVLEAYNTNAAFFINPNFIDGDVNYKKDFLKRINVKNKEPLNWGEVIALSNKGHVIGAHTMDHLDLGNESLTIEELKAQIVDCKKLIENKIKANCSIFAFPFGQKQNLSIKALQIAKEHYKYIFSSTDYKKYFSFNNDVINRRHCEPFWPVSHLNYFLNCEKTFNP